jgi:hypothetical protein
MSRRPQRWFVALVLASFLLGVFACFITCAEGDDDCQHSLPSQCLCVCQSPALVPMLPIAVPVPDVGEFVPLPAHVKLRLIVASIFQPPRM